MSLQATTSQTVGPYFDIGMRWHYQENLVGAGVAGKQITIQGRVLDGDGSPVPDAILEIWQANSHGKYAHQEDTQSKPMEQGFSGYGRVPTDNNGAFRFTTIKPGPVPGPGNKDQAPHILVSIFMRGLLTRLITRIYFPNDPGNTGDYILNLVEAERRPTLIAKPVGGQTGVLVWNVALQGENETVFFELGV